VTGSVNQRGEIQPVGGINEKIEGYFDTCRARGFTGDQGVAIPEGNVLHLMLRDGVVSAVRDGTFSVHAVATVDEALTLLSKREAGVPDASGQWAPGTFNEAVRRALRDNVERLKAMREAPAVASIGLTDGAARSG
jgi:predicted ATP-dependent protease